MRDKRRETLINQSMFPIHTKLMFPMYMKPTLDKYGVEITQSSTALLRSEARQALLVFPTFMTKRGEHYKERDNSEHAEDETKQVR